MSVRNLLCNTNKKSRNKSCDRSFALLHCCAYFTHSNNRGQQWAHIPRVLGSPILATALVERLVGSVLRSTACRPLSTIRIKPATFRSQAYKDWNVNMQTLRVVKCIMSPHRTVLPDCPFLTHLERTFYRSIQVRLSGHLNTSFIT